MNANVALPHARLFAAGFLVVVVGACRETIDPRRVTLKDEGSLCLGLAVEGVDGGDAGKGATGVDLRAGQPLAISVRTPCLSNYCATARSSKCTVKREGKQLVVTSQLSWIGPEDLGTACPQDCTFLDAQCMTEALPEGHYKVVLGSQTVDVALPSHLDVRCEGDKPSGRYVPALPVVVAAPPPATPAANVDPQSMPAAPGTGVVAEAPPGDTICIGPSVVASKNRALKTGQPIAVTVLHKNQCLGASCTKAPGKCAAKRKGSTIVVTTQFPSATTKPTLPCTEDCNAIAATCRTDALPAGTYTLEIGAQRKTVQIPAVVAPPCGP